MDELTRRLRDADPTAREPELSAFEVAVMRQRAIVAAREPEARHPAAWQAAFAFGAIAALAAAATLFDSRGERSIDQASSSVASEGSATVHIQPPVTQVQFQTPGGTRIVWTINPELTF